LLLNLLQQLKLTPKLSPINKFTSDNKNGSALGNNFAGVSDLPAGFGVERRLVQEQNSLVVLLQNIRRLKFRPKFNLRLKPKKKKNKQREILLWQEPENGRFKMLSYHKTQSYYST